MIAPVAQQWEGPEPHGLGPSPIVCCPSAHPCCAGDARGSGSRSGAVSIGGIHATPRPQPESVTDALHACSTKSAREALHPLRRDTPVTSRYTRSVALHPIRRDAPDQKRCNAYGSGAPPPTTSPTAGNSPPQTPTVRPGRCDTASTCSPGSEREALHPLRRNAPVTSRCTHYVTLHPLRRGAPVTSRCTRSEGV